MSLKKGNEYFKQSQYEEAITEYNKVEPYSPLYSQALLNIKRSTLHLEKNVQPGLDKPKEKKINNINQPLISIVMPVYNVAQYLDASINSVLFQTCSNFELIIVNDASTDNAKNIIDMYASLDQRVKAIHLEHNTLGGAGIPSNIGIRHATGEYVGFVDSDDWVSKDAFQKMLTYAFQFQADLAIGDFCTFEEDTRKVKEAYDKKSWDNLPLHKLIIPATHPDLFKLSPVPWRKIYKRDFLLNNKLFYPEGDYFYEDNPLHWMVLAKATRLVLTDTIVAYHRMARAGQTMSSSAYRLAAMCCHVNTIGDYINKISSSQQIIDEYYDYCYRTVWVANKQERQEDKAIIEKQLSKIVEKNKKRIPPKNLRGLFENNFRNYFEAYPDVDLTIVIPAYNCGDLIYDTIKSVSSLNKIKFNILLIDDGSDDNTLQVCFDIAKKYKNLHIFSQSNKGAGRARNALVPLITGQYTYFLDADDIVDADNLEKAFFSAKNGCHDLYFFKYKIQFYDKKQTRNMFDADAKQWKQLNSAKTNIERKTIVAGLINYPWNRIIKTDLLHDENIFFGPTVVHNDIPFHWHSIIAAKNIGFSNESVCIHRKFEDRQQVTNIADKRRLTVFEALRFTQEKITQYDSFKDIQKVWFDFSEHVIDWAKSRVPDDLQREYQLQKDNFNVVSL